MTLKEFVLLEEVAKYYHVGIIENLTKDKIRRSPLEPSGFKPNGFWVAKGKHAFQGDLIKLGVLDRFGENETFNYEVQIDLSNIYIVSDRASWINFVNEFGTEKIDDDRIKKEMVNTKEKMKKHGTYDSMPESIYRKMIINDLYKTAVIDWPKVSRKYDGFGITKPGTIKPYSNLARYWRFNSIVLFNENPVLNIKAIK